MVSNKTFRQLALSFKETVELPHFEKTSFRTGKKIFATLDEKNCIAVLKLSEINQSVFCAFDKSIIYPVPGKWGKLGWTVLKLSKVKKAMLEDALKTAYCEVAPKSLAIQIKKENK